MFTPQQLLEIKDLLHNKQSIIIVTHYNPDGDAIGSSLGLQHYLKCIGVEANVVVPNDFPKFLKWMPDAKKATIADYKRKKASSMIEEADLMFILDFNAPHRAGNLLGPWIEKSNATKILIDHHQQPEDFDYIYSDTTQPATAQMVYHFIDAMGDAGKINLDTANCLYTGIMTDTGGFKYRSTSADTHRIVANLIEVGVDPSEIVSNTWDNNSVSRLKLLSLVLGRIELTKNDEVAIMYLKRNELEEYGFQKGDTEGFVNYGLSVAGVKMSALFIEDLYEEFVKISFRSKDAVDCNQFARKYFDGGGHINAAGGKSYKNISSTIEYFKEKIAEEDF